MELSTAVRIVCAPSRDTRRNFPGLMSLEGWLTGDLVWGGWTPDSRQEQT
jgi:hypothetical protein